ncbi:UNVERIFIED_CONTAM: hypothetical protein Sradi_1904600 [Sesamum radiatum]|uniref:Uncharacterized protein n=1 Tax=Sesamum radiatum TaxID=300843 RepID=A0AAW2TZI0_SESRA
MDKRGREAKPNHDSLQKKLLNPIIRLTNVKFKSHEILFALGTGRHIVVTKAIKASSVIRRLGMKAA